MIVTDEQLLRRPCEPVKDVSEGGAVARKLWAALERHNKHAMKVHKRTGGKASTVIGVGLAAPQIGILKQVAVIKVGGLPLVLMNPEVVEASASKVPYTEGCLSFPGVEVETERHIWVKVKCLNLPGVHTFGPTTPEGWQNNTLLLRSIAVQHEIDHLRAVLFTDRGKVVEQESKAA
jgi:peptide deformylase